MENGNVPGKGKATASLILGIISVCCAWFGWGAIAGIVCGIIGAVLSVGASKDGYTQGMQKAGIVLSVIGIILGAIIFIACTICAGALACMA